MTLIELGCTRCMVMYSVTLICLPMIPFNFPIKNFVARRLKNTLTPTHTHSHVCSYYTDLEENELDFSLPLLLTPPESPFSPTDSPCSPSDINNRLSTLHHGNTCMYSTAVYQARNSAIISIGFSPLMLYM